MRTLNGIQAFANMLILVEALGWKALDVPEAVFDAFHDYRYRCYQYAPGYYERRVEPNVGELSLDGYTYLSALDEILACRRA